MLPVARSPCFCSSIGIDAYDNDAVKSSSLSHDIPSASVEGVTRLKPFAEFALYIEHPTMMY